MAGPGRTFEITASTAFPLVNGLFPQINPGVRNGCPPAGFEPALSPPEGGDHAGRLMPLTWASEVVETRYSGSWPPICRSAGAKTASH